MVSEKVGMVITIAIYINFRMAMTAATIKMRQHLKNEQCHSNLASLV